VRASRLIRAPGQIRRPEDAEAKVTPLELFFDLVFVFALTQVTAFMAREPTFESMGRALLVLALVWWAWSGYAWLTSLVDPEQTPARIVMFMAMGAMLVVALATPRAFAGNGVAWACGYIAVRLLHAALFGVAARGDPALARNVLFLLLAIVPGGGLILAGALAFDGGATRNLLWLAAVLLDYGIVIGLADTASWSIHPEHFAERFELVTLIAFGESIVAIGVGAQELALDGQEIVTALVAIAVVCALWWSYFDTSALMAARRLREQAGAALVSMARDAYALLHLPMVAGVVLFALGVKKALEAPGAPLAAMPATGLCGGLALFALAELGVRARTSGTIAWPRAAVAGASVALIPLATGASGLAALAALLVVWTVMVVYETTKFRDVRAALRAQD
jgi:low temperature requirement protein LtrA